MRVRGAGAGQETGGKTGSTRGGEEIEPQQSKMRACNKEAKEKKLKGEERKKFMSACLKG